MDISVILSFHIQSVGARPNLNVELVVPDTAVTPVTVSGTWPTAPAGRRPGPPDRPQATAQAESDRRQSEAVQVGVPKVWNVT